MHRAPVWRPATHPPPAADLAVQRRPTQQRRLPHPGPAAAPAPPGIPLEIICSLLLAASLERWSLVLGRRAGPDTLRPFVEAVVGGRTYPHLRRCAFHADDSAHVAPLVSDVCTLMRHLSSVTHWKLGVAAGIVD